MTQRIFYSRERDLARFHRFEDALKPFVQKWCWSRSVSAADNARARSDLVRFIEAAKSLMKKTIRYDLDPLDPLADGMGYLRRMMILRESLQRQRYDIACHDLSANGVTPLFQLWGYKSIEYISCTRSEIPI